ncbi:Smr/MutS family protein, partial [bacterium]|nr:Smr/MutS family protein [bacterium]
LTEGGNEEKTEPFAVTNIKTRDKIDIRGMRVEEALPDVEAVLNEAYVAGFANVYILHGKGTGKLKEGIRAYLSTHPLVDNYNDSYEGEQHNAGITVAELKKR